MELKFYDISSFSVQTMIIINTLYCILNDNEISLNFNSIYLILQFTLYSFLK